MVYLQIYPKTRKYALVECLDYHIPVTQLMETPGRWRYESTKTTFSEIEWCHLAGITIFNHVGNRQILAIWEFVGVAFG